MIKQSPQVLLVDDNPADVELVRVASAGGKYGTQIHSEENGEKALAYLRHMNQSGIAMPDLILLDLNLPGKCGLEVLVEVKGDPNLCETPVVIFSSSQLQRDIRACYQAGANCYVRKPGELEEFFSTMRAIEEFWFESAWLPERDKNGNGSERTSY